MPEAKDIPAPVVRNVFAYGGFVKLLSASFLAALGDRFYQAVMLAASSSIFLKDTANREFTRVQIVSILPMLILYAFVGSLVDSANRRRLLAWIQGIKVILVLGFAVLLWDAVAIQKSDVLPAAWSWGLGLIVMLNVITVPFSPGRMAVVPDVLPEERRAMGASLVATAGLFSYLIGSFAGIKLASFGMLGPVKMTFAASACYLLATWLFAAMPDETAVPGNQRKGGDPEAPTETPPAKMSLKEYAVEQWDGFKYCLKRPSLLALILFESTFWIVAAMILTLIAFYASDVLKYSGDDKNNFVGNALGIAGLGLLTGALFVGKISRNVSPICTYFPAFILIAIGFKGVFGGAPVEESGRLAAAWSFQPLLFILGFGGGSLLGRVDADVLSVADERFRGRILALKAVCFAAGTLGSLIWIGESMTPEGKFALIWWMPRILLWSLPLVFILAWAVDAAIWAHRAEFGPPTFRDRMQFKFCRSILWVWMKLQFRFTVIGADKVPKSGAVILAANHGSFLDPIFMGCACPRMVQYLMYSSYYTSFAHPIFRFLSAIPVDEKKSLMALRTGVASLEKGCCIGVFPEGQVAREKKLNQPQGGALFLAQRSGATVVPVALKGNWDAYPRAAKFPRFKKVTVIFGAPFVVKKDATKQEVAAAAEGMMAQIAGMLGVAAPLKDEGVK